MARFQLATNAIRTTTAPPFAITSAETASAWQKSNATTATKQDALAVRLPLGILVLRTPSTGQCVLPFAGTELWSREKPVIMETKSAARPTVWWTGTIHAQAGLDKCQFALVSVEIPTEQLTKPATTEN